MQGNPGEGKTTFALRLAAACTTGGTLPGMKPLPPFQVIYQTAEDGLGDTVKPRLIEAEADLDRVLVIDEAKRELTLSDERIEKAITQNGARLIILDPIQAYMGEKTDMNRANEVRPMFRRLADVAERTGCAVILIGHLNKAAGGQSAYRGLGSIDFRAAARSVLLIGRVKREPNVRVIVHDKSSLAPEGKPVAFCLDPETGFSWIGEYDITADELLSGAGGNTATKTEQAEKLIPSSVSFCVKGRLVTMYLQGRKPSGRSALRRSDLRGNSSMPSSTLNGMNISRRPRQVPASNRRTEPAARLRPFL